VANRIGDGLAKGGYQPGILVGRPPGAAAEIQQGALGDLDVFKPAR
jgi:hypothetical protein